MCIRDSDLKRAVRDGVAYEEAVKTGRMNDQMAVELFIVQYSADMTLSLIHIFLLILFSS